MVSIQIFLLGLLVVSTLTGLTTEALKTFLSKKDEPYCSNTLAGFVALFLSILVGIAYILMNGIPITSQIIVCLVALVFMSWLCAMVGYDKVVQAISQFKTYRKNGDE